MNKNLKRLILLFLVALLATIAWQYPKLNLISGFAAKSTASSIFIAGRSLNSVTENDNNVPLVKLAESHYDATEKKGIASVFGLMEREAVCRDGLGCVLVNGDIDVDLYTQIPSRSRKHIELPYPSGHENPVDTVFENVNYKQIEKALDHVFADTVKTRTVLILYKDHILAERYKSGFDASTPILGWSMTKSVLATLFGILEYPGKIVRIGPCTASFLAGR